MRRESIMQMLFKGLLAMFVLLAATCPLAHAQSASFCIFTVPNAGDPMINGIAGQPTHNYYSQIYNGSTDRSSQFLAWLRRTYGGTWKNNPYSNSDGAAGGCLTYPSFSEAQSHFQSGYGSHNAVNRNSYNTQTDWPNVPNP